MADAFAIDLIRTARSFDIAATPFIRSLQEGTCDRAAIAAYALNLCALGERFPRVLASIYAICPEPAVQHSLLANLLEEEGVVGVNGTSGMRIDPARRHGAMARRFAVAAGVDEKAIERAHWSAPRFDDLLRRQEWLAAFAWTSVGVEANVPRTFALLVPPLKEHYGFADGDLVFLTEHLTADERHGADAAELIAAVATTDAMRARALEGARHGAAAWWLMHRECGRRGA